MVNSQLKQFTVVDRYIENFKKLDYGSIDKVFCAVAAGEQRA